MVFISIGNNFSIAGGVGMIALSGLAAEFGIIMLVYLDDAIEGSSGL